MNCENRSGLLPAARPGPAAAPLAPRPPPRPAPRPPPPAAGTGGSCAISTRQPAATAAITRSLAVYILFDLTWVHSTLHLQALGPGYLNIALNASGRKASSFNRLVRIDLQKYPQKLYLSSEPAKRSALSVVAKVLERDDVRLNRSVSYLSRLRGRSTRSKSAAGGGNLSSSTLAETPPPRPPPQAGEGAHFRRCYRST